MMTSSRLTKRDVPQWGLSWPSADSPLILLVAGFGICAITSVFVHKLLPVLIGMAVGGLAGIPSGVLCSAIGLREVRAVAQRCHDNPGLMLPAAFGMVHSRAAWVFGFVVFFLFPVALGLGVLALAGLHDLLWVTLTSAVPGMNMHDADRLADIAFFLSFALLTYALYWRAVKRWYDSLPN